MKARLNREEIHRVVFKIIVREDSELNPTSDIIDEAIKEVLKERKQR